MMKTKIFFAFFYSALLASNVYAKSTISSDQIRQAVKDYIQTQLSRELPKSEHQYAKIRVRQVDNRLRLSQCDQPLGLSLQNKRIQQSNSVKVSCRGSASWAIYVGATISLEKPVAVLRSDLPRRHTLAENDIMLLPRDTFSLRDGYSINAEALIGQELKRPLRAGDVIYSYHLQVPEIIKKGDRVRVIIKRGSLSVISSGIALQDASEGERIRVENQRSSRVIQARVTGPHTVEVL